MTQPVRRMNWHKDDASSSGSSHWAMFQRAVWRNTLALGLFIHKPPAGLSSMSARPLPRQWAATASAPGAGEATTQSSRSTRNYELDRTIRHVRNAMGKVEKLSVAVVINEREAPAGAASAPGADGVPAGYTPQEVERMLNLVRGVVGFDEKRGDVVTRGKAIGIPVKSQSSCC